MELYIITSSLQVVHNYGVVYYCMSLQVVHNYGHGAEGISLSWGTSVNAIQLAKEMLDESAESPINIHSKL